MNYKSDSKEWAEQMFGRCQLGDPRRVSRLVDFASRMAENPDASISRACKEDNAAREGAYKLIENQAVRPDEIRAGVSRAVAAAIDPEREYLIIQDTTGLSFRHSVVNDVRENGCPLGHLVHSSLLVDAETRSPVGLIDQDVWLRENRSLRPGFQTRKTRKHEDKESVKWANSFLRAKEILPTVSNVITVGDREADVYEFLHLLQQNGGRYVIRVCQNRRLHTDRTLLFDAIRNQPILGTHTVHIGQRGALNYLPGKTRRDARSSREANTNIQTISVTLRAPVFRRNARARTPISINVVHVFEPENNTTDEPISWMLLTSEPVDSLDDALKVVGYYSKRWLVEEFHKVWKSGCMIEARKLQSLENLERMMAITAPLAVRMLQLRSLVDEEPESTCESVFSVDEWHCLWIATQKGAAMPESPPTLKWAYFSLARMAGWSDSKRTQRVGWDTIWIGWQQLARQVEGWLSAKAFFANVGK